MANGQIDIIVAKQAKNEVDEAIVSVSKLNDAIIEVSKNARKLAETKGVPTVPKELETRLQANAEAMSKMSTEIDNLKIKIKELKEARTRANKPLTEEEKLTKSVTAAKKKLSLATSAENKELQQTRQQTNAVNKGIRSLSGAYDTLSAKRLKAKKDLQDLIVRGKKATQTQKQFQKELLKTQRRFDGYDKKIKKADKATKDFSRNVGNYKSAFGGALGAIRKFLPALGAFTALQIGKEVFNVVKELDGMNKALKLVTDTTDNYVRAQAFVRDLSEEAGVEILGLNKSYVKFLASAKTTNLTLDETEDIFRQVAKAGSSLGLSADDINGSFRALEQILSKGKVQAEEIRGQLGERLPGAFQILAKSMGLTTAELNKQLELGQVISDEVLPNFAKELEKTFGLENITKVNTLAAAQARLGNAWIKLIGDIEGSDGVLSNAFAGILNFTTAILESLTEIDEKLKEAFKSDVVKRNEQSVSAIVSIFNRAKLGLNKFTDAQDRYSAAVESEEISNKRLQNRLNEVIKDKTTLGFINDRLNETSVEGLNNLFKEEFLLKNLSEENKSYIGLQAVRIKASREVQEETAEEIEVMLGLKNTMNKSIEALKEIIKENKALIETTEDDTYRRRLLQENILLEKQIKLLRAVPKAVKAINAISVGVVTKEELERRAKIGTTTETALSGGTTRGGLTFAGDPAQEATDRARKARSGLGGSGFESVVGDVAGFVEKYGEQIDQAIDITNHFFDNRIERIDQDIEKQTEFFDKQIEMAEGNAEKQKGLEIEKSIVIADLEKKRQKEVEKQAIFNKAISVADSIINTAVAVTELGVVTPQAILAGVLGAAQVAAIIATPIPKFAEGTDKPLDTDTVAWVGDGGKHEVITKNGQLLGVSPNTPTLAALPKGAEVHKDLESYVSNYDADAIARAAVMTSINNDGNTLNSYQVLDRFNMNLDKFQGQIKNEIERGIKRGFANLPTPEIELGEQLAALERKNKK